MHVVYNVGIVYTYHVLTSSMFGKWKSFTNWCLCGDSLHNSMCDDETKMCASNCMIGI